MSYRFSETNDHNSTEMQEAARLTHSTGWKRDAVCVTAWSDDKMVAVAVYQNISDTAAEFHVALADRGMSMPAKVIQLFVVYALKRLRVRYLQAFISTANPRAMSAAIKCGFVPCGFLQAGAMCLFDAMVLTLDVQNSSWLPTQPVTMTITPEPGAAGD